MRLARKCYPYIWNSRLSQLLARQPAKINLDHQFLPEIELKNPEIYPVGNLQTFMYVCA